MIGKAIGQALVIFTRWLEFVDYQTTGRYERPQACEERAHARVTIIESRRPRRGAAA